LVARSSGRATGSPAWPWDDRRGLYQTGWEAISAHIKTYVNPNRKISINRAFAAAKNEKLVLSHNHDDSEAKIKNKVGKTTGRMGMKTVRRLRAMASLCRQGAAYRPDRSWKLLAEAEYWEHLANAALLQHFQDCTASLTDQTQPQPTANAMTHDARRLPVA